MNVLSDWYANGYLAASCLAVVAIFIRFSRHLTSEERLLSAALLCPLVLAYLAGMNRSDGIDFDTYSAAYDQTGQAIPDLGYSALTWLTFHLGIDFSTFLLLQGIFTLAALWIASKARQADPIVVLAIYLLHLAIVRDMSQSRIGLAVAIYLLGQTRERSIWRWTLYAIAMSMHITVAIIVIVWGLAAFSARWRASRQILFVYVPLAAFAAFGVVLLDLLSFVDPRIDIYLSWDEAAYGAPLESYGALARTALMVAAYLAASSRFKNLNLRPYLVSELAAAAILIGFAQYSIFAARLSNVAISMYPIGIGAIALAYQQLPMQRNRLLTSAALKCTIAVIAAVLVLRPGSLDALRVVVPNVLAVAGEWD